VREWAVAVGFSLVDQTKLVLLPVDLIRKSAQLFSRCRVSSPKDYQTNQ
jgi:hypothetical protein